MQVKLTLETKRADGSPGTSYDGSNTTAPDPCEALAAELEEAAEYLRNEQVTDIVSATMTITITP